MTIVMGTYPTVTQVELSLIPVKGRSTPSLYMSELGSMGIVVLSESEAVCNIVRPVLSLRNLDDVIVVGKRILSFCEYHDGWMGEGSKGPDVYGLKWLAKAFASYFEQHPTPAVFLTPNGDVEMEWRNSGRSVSLTVSLSSRVAVWYSFSLEDNHDEKDYEETIILNKEGWKRLNNLIQGLFSIE